VIINSGDERRDNRGLSKEDREKEDVERRRREQYWEGGEGEIGLIMYSDSVDMPNLKDLV